MRPYQMIIRILICTAAILIVANLISCGEVKITITKKIQRVEIPPYIEQVFGEFNDSCRLVSIKKNGYETEYLYICKNGAKKFRKYVFDKAFPRED